MFRYEIAFGTNRGDTDILAFETVPKGELYYVAVDLNLTTVRQVFASVRAFNEAGLNATAVSSGVYVSRVSAGLPPLESSYVYDGSRSNIDV